MEGLIESRANPKIVETAKLSDRKYREREGVFCFEGSKLLAEAVSAGIPLKSVFCTEEAAGSFPDLIRSVSCPVFPVSSSVYEKLTFEKAPEGLFSVAKHLDNLIFSHTIYKKHSHLSAIMDRSRERFFLCEGIRDPGNAGTLIRTANALGIGRLVWSPDCADPYHPRTVRAAMGALFRQRQEQTDDLPAYIRALRADGYPVYAAALREDAVSLRDLPDRAGAVFVVGNEGHGLSEETIAACSGCVRIPMAEGAESLNVSSAASILMWESAGENR